MDRITIGLIDHDWQTIAGNTFFAKRGAAGEFGFGKSAAEALKSLEDREALRSPTFDVTLAEEIAFLALGAADYLRHLREVDLYRHGGYMGLIAEIVSHAPMVLDRWNRISHGEFPGVWLYDVTERFGYELARLLLKGEQGNPADLLERLVIEETGDLPSAY